MGKIVGKIKQRMQNGRRSYTLRVSKKYKLVNLCYLVGALDHTKQNALYWLMPERYPRRGLKAHDINPMTSKYTNIGANVRIKTTASVINVRTMNLFFILLKTWLTNFYGALKCMIIRYIRGDVRLLGRERKSKIRKGEFLLFRDMVLKDFWLQQTLGHGKK